MRRHLAGPGNELFGVALAAGKLGGSGIGKGFLVVPHAATDEPQKRLRPEQHDQRAARGEPAEVVIGHVGELMGQDGAELFRRLRFQPILG